MMKLRMSPLPVVLVLSLFLNLVFLGSYLFKDKGGQRLHTELLYEYELDSVLKFLNHYFTLTYEFTPETYVSQQIASLVFLDESLRNSKISEIESIQEKIIQVGVIQGVVLNSVIQQGPHQYQVDLTSNILEGGNQTTLSWSVDITLAPVTRDAKNNFGWRVLHFDRRYQESDAQPAQIIRISKDSRPTEVIFPCPLKQVRSDLSEHLILRLISDSESILRVTLRDPSISEFKLDAVCPGRQFKVPFVSEDKSYHLFKSWNPSSNANAVPTRLSGRGGTKSKPLTKSQIHRMLQEQLGIVVEPGPSKTR